MCCGSKVRELGGTLVYRRSEPLAQLRALGGWAVGPVALIKGSPRGRHGRVDVLRRGCGYRADLLFGAG
jgi:hypothetical protein